MKLFRYITGANARNANIPMTVPVLTKIEPSRTAMLFYLPSPSPPRPSDDDVTLFSLPRSRFYVRTFTTNFWTSARNWHNAQTALEAELRRMGRSWNTNVVYRVGYDSPMTLFGRHNEIWLEVQQ